MLVYALQQSPRLGYILEFIGKDIFNEDIQQTSDQQFFINYDGPKINYGSERITRDEFWICNVELLFEKDTRDQGITCFEFKGNKAFFQNGSGDFSFDIFAASFYLLSRYEEYLPHTKDKYGRYAHTNSIAFKESFLHQPLINTWFKYLRKALLQKYPGLQFREKTFTFLPTYDIDIAWSYINKGWWRNTGGLLMSAIKFDWNVFNNRLDVLFKKKQDPFDSYAWLNAIHKLLDLHPIYFFLLAFKQKGYDKNISPLKKNLKRLIIDHDLLYTTGIHPSWQSGDNDALLESEIKQLEQLVDHDIIHSRQHYLRFTLPVTYQKLIGLGIKNDYSMGYGTINGFRASVASPFFWYDLQNDRATDLLIHPFCFMDANAYYELKLTPAQALTQLVDFFNVIKEVDGLMITLWHNNFLGTDKSFVGWREVYETFLKEIGYKDDFKP